eukprot:m.81369 g.81369  ORF g.81369 m.81369 type:complete len:1480 (+) comp12809_c0_seq2:178-4617(+)
MFCKHLQFMSYFLVLILVTLVHSQIPIQSCNGVPDEDECANYEPTEAIPDFCNVAGNVTLLLSFQNRVRTNCPALCGLCPSTSTITTSTISGTSTATSIESECNGLEDPVECGVEPLTPIQCNNPVDIIRNLLREECPVMCKSCQLTTKTTITTTTVTTTLTSTATTTATTTTVEKCNGLVDPPDCDFEELGDQLCTSLIPGNENSDNLAQKVRDQCPILCDTCETSTATSTDTSTETSTATSTLFNGKQCDGEFDPPECGGAIPITLCNNSVSGNATREKCPAMCDACETTTATSTITTTITSTATSTQTTITATSKTQTTRTQTSRTQTSKTSTTSTTEPPKCNGVPDSHECRNIPVTIFLNGCNASHPDILIRNLSLTARAKCPLRCNTCDEATPDCDPEQARLVPLNGNLAGKICRPVNTTFTSRLPLIASLGTNSGQASISHMLEANPDGTYSTKATLGTAVKGARAVVQCTGISSPRATSPVATKQFQGEIVDTILRSSSIYFDEVGGAKVDASIQLRDSFQYDVNVLSTPVKLSLVPQSQAVAFNTMESNSACRNIICDLSVSVATNRPVSGPVLLNVVLTVDSNNYQLGNVTYVPQKETIPSTTENTIYTTIPSRTLLPGDQFTLEVRSRFKFFLKTAAFRIIVGSGLRILSGSTPSSFELGLADVENTQASTVLAGRKDGASSTEQASITDELLVTLRLSVQSSSLENSTIQFTSLNNLVNLADIGLSASAIGVMETRNGVVVTENIPSGGTLNSSQAGLVHFGTDDVKGIFAYSTGPTELINTAALSGTQIQSGITVTSIRQRGGRSSVTNAVCRSADTDAINALASGCGGRLTGQETKGAGRVDIQVAILGFQRQVPFRVHFVDPRSVAVSMTTTLRPIAGLFDNSDTTCNTLKYSESMISATASFSDGVNTISEYDVTLLLDLKVSDGNVAEIVKRQGIPYITGKQAGATTVVASTNDLSQQLASVGVTVTDQSTTNMLAVAGLDVVLLSSLGTVTIQGSSPYDRYTSVNIQMTAPTTGELKFEDDVLNVVASVVFEDGSRMGITTATGLILRSNNEKAIVVSEQSIVVPFDPEGDSGPLLYAAWRPAGACEANNTLSLSSFSARNVSVEVKPPPADRMILSQPEAFVVPVGDAASRPGADFPTTTQISMRLSFPGSGVKNIANSDPRSSFVSSNPALFTVSTSGLVTANSAGVTGTGFILGSFAGQNVTSNVSVTVEKVKSMRLTSEPFPTYTGSSAVSAITVSTIACTNPTLFQSLLFKTTMVLTNDDEKLIAGSRITYSLSSTSDFSMSAPSATRVLSSSGVSTTEVEGTFFDTTSNTLTITSSDDKRTVSTVDSLRVGRVNNPYGGSPLSTLSGFKQAKQQFQMGLGVTLSDNRKYTRAFDNSGTPALKGALSFRSDTPLSLTIDNETGVMTLLDNHHSPVSIDVLACGDQNPTGNRIQVFLQPCSSNWRYRFRFSHRISCLS